MKKKTINKEVFGKRLSELMTLNNETTYTMADEFSLTSPTISRYVTGQMAAKITTIEQMANYFKVNPIWLMGYDVPKEKVTNPLKDTATNEKTRKLVDFLIKNPEYEVLIESMRYIDKGDIELVMQLLKKFRKNQKE